MLYLELYNHIYKYGKWDDALIQKKLPQIKRHQQANLKANLFKQILRSLKDIHKEHYLEIKAREQFDFAKILYTKGLYKASLDMLNRVKLLATRTNKLPLVYLALDFEKHIEAQHVTGSMSPKAILLSDESKAILDRLQLTNKLSNLSLLMYGKYLEIGLVRSEKDLEELKHSFEHKLTPYLEMDLDFYQKLYLYQAFVRYYIMIQDFAKYYLFAKRWVSLYEENLEMRKIETVVYIKGLHNVSL